MQPLRVNYLRKKKGGSFTIPGLQSTYNMLFAYTQDCATSTVLGEDYIFYLKLFPPIWLHFEQPQLIADDGSITEGSEKNVFQK